MITGTCHFTGFKKALTYFRSHCPLGERELKIYVQRKVSDGEIKIGPPAPKENEALGVDKDGRYFIKSKI